MSFSCSIFICGRSADDLKTFHCQILNDHKALREQQDNYRPVPIVRNLASETFQRVYLEIKPDVQDIVDSEIERISADPELAYLMVRK